MAADGGAIIRKAGAVSPVGIGIDQTAASVRADVARFEESGVLDKRLDPFKMALIPEAYLEPLVPELEAQPGLTSRQGRMLRLAGPALGEAAESCRATAGTPLFLGVPEPMGNRPDPAGARFLEQLQRQSGVSFDTGASRMFPEGRAAGLLALKEALVYLESGNGEQVLVGGVDSYLDLYLLSTLDAEERIAGSVVMDGFIPGEGAAFLLLGAAGAQGDGGRPSDLVISGVGTAQEPGHRYADNEPYRGEGLSLAVEELTEALADEPEPVKTVFAGLNGESFWAKEWGTSYLRHSSLFADEFEVEHPADCFGDIGAALGPMMVALAHVGTREKHLTGPFLVWCSSDRAQRACAYLTASP